MRNELERLMCEHGLEAIAEALEFLCLSYADKSRDNWTRREGAVLWAQCAEYAKGLRMAAKRCGLSGPMAMPQPNEFN